MTVVEQQSALKAILSVDRNTVVDASLRLSSCKGLTKILVKMLETERRVTNRHAIVYALAWQGDLRAWWPFLKLFADVSEAPLVRGQAAEGLEYLFYRKQRGSLSHRTGLQVLRWGLADPSPEVRACAVIALGASRDREVLPWLQQMTTDTGTPSSAAGTVGHQAVEAMDWVRR